VRQQDGDTYLEFDADGDGHVDYVQRLRGGYKDRLIFGGGVCGKVVERPAVVQDGRPVVFLLLDGVAFERIGGLYASGRFRLFRPPARVISVFPTLTDPAYDLLFRTGPTPGFEPGYFDRGRNRSTGAIWDYLRGANEAWVRFTDYRLRFIEDAVMYLLPRWVFALELRRARRVVDDRLRAGRQRVAIYLLSTDGLGHMLEASEIDRELLRLDEWIERLVYDYRGLLELVLVSDHGLSQLPPEQAPVRRFNLHKILRDNGLRMQARLRRPGDVVLPQFGLLDVARVHTFDEETREKVVETLRARPEVEFVAARDAQCVRVYRGSQVAVVSARGGAKGDLLYSYHAESGDPLELAGAVAQLREAGLMSADGHATAAAWLRASAGLPFPSAPQRLWQAFFVVSREQPDVIVCLTKCWYVGSGLLSGFVKMWGTHGGLHRRASETFAMATNVDFPAVMDLDLLRCQLREWFGWPA